MAAAWFMCCSVAFWLLFLVAMEWATERDSSERADTRRVAYHEAGHAVAAMAMGMAVHDVWAWGWFMGGRALYVSHPWVDPMFEAVVAAAGAAAEGMLAGSPVVVSGTDRVVVEGMGVSPDAALAVAAMVLGGRWGDVELLAGELVARGHVDAGGLAAMGLSGKGAVR
jgi:hypothetical protein